MIMFPTEVGFSIKLNKEAAASRWCSSPTGNVWRVKNSRQKQRKIASSPHRRLKGLLKKLLLEAG
jgi:hypothetical protein